MQDQIFSILDAYASSPTYIEQLRYHVALKTKGTIDNSVIIDYINKWLHLDQSNLLDK